MPDPAPLAAAVGDAAGILLELGLVVGILALLARLAVRTGFSPIPLYLLAGLALGALDPIELSARFIETGAQLGVILLLFALGLEYTGEELVSSLRSGARAGVVDLAVNFAPGFAAGLLLGWGPVSALLLGGVTVISSSGVIAKVLADLGRLGNRETPAILSILVIEDLALAFYLPFVAVLLSGASVAAAVGSIGIAIAAALGALVAAIRLGPLLSRVVLSRSDEVLLLSVLGIVLLVAGAAEGLNVSAAVGAFLVGIAVSGQVASRTAELVAPLRDLFAAVFFVFFGLQIDAGALPDVAAVAAVLALITAATKLVTGWLAAAWAGVGVRGRLRAGTALVARGEFSIVIAGLGVAAGAKGELGALAAAYVLLLGVAGPVLTRYADRLERLLVGPLRQPRGKV